MTNEELVTDYQNGNKQALDVLVEKNKGLVYLVANKFYTDKTASIDIEDLEQEGFMGLMRAAQKYDLTMENRAKFSTYAVNWIYQRISRFLSQKNTNDETSLNAPIGAGDEEIELKDTIVDEQDHYEGVEVSVYVQELRKELNNAMDVSLTLRESQTLKLYYGWDAMPMTLKEINFLHEGSNSSQASSDRDRGLRKLRHSQWGSSMAKERAQEKLESVTSIDKMLDNLTSQYNTLEQLRQII